MYYLPKVKIKAMAQLSRRRADAESRYEDLRNQALAKIPALRDLEAKIAYSCVELCRVIGMGDEAMQHIETLKQENLSAQKQQQELLAAHGFPADCMKVRYSCPVCADTGFSDDGRFCECHKLLLRELEHERLSELFPLNKFTFESFSLNYYPLEHRGEMEGTLETCREYARNFHTEMPSLFFYGETGLGKTHLSGAIINEVIKQGFGVEYGRAPQLFPQMTKERFDNRSQEYTQQALLSSDLFVLDDLGAEAANSITIELLYNLIDTRLCKGLPTIISSNCMPQELQERYGRRIASRLLYEGYETFRFMGTDIREQMAEG